LRDILPVGSDQCTISAGHRKQYVAWLQSAKEAETRKFRLEEAIRLLEKNQKLGMK